MEQKNNLPEKAEQITTVVVKSVFELELAQQKFRELLTEAQQIVFTKENITQDYGALKKLKELRKALEISKDNKKAPHLAANKAIQAAYNEYDALILDVLDRQTTAFKKVNDEIKADNLRIQQELEKNNAIQQALTTFINTTTASITNAQNDAEIVRIQKAIGSEKARIGFYESHIEELRIACDNMKPIIDERKAVIRKKAKLEEEQEAALKIGDINKATELKEDIEFAEAEMNENALRIQEKAFQQAVNIPVIVGESTTESVKGRVNWKWDVPDIELLRKKAPHLTQVIPDKQKITELLQSKRLDGSLKGKSEEWVFGIKFYNDEII